MWTLMTWSCIELKSVLGYYHPWSMCSSFLSGTWGMRLRADDSLNSNFLSKMETFLQEMMLVGMIFSPQHLQRSLWWLSTKDLSCSLQLSLFCAHCSTLISLWSHIVSYCVIPSCIVLDYTVLCCIISGDGMLKLWFPCFWTQLSLHSTGTNTK